MTAQELIEALSKMPPNAQVGIQEGGARIYGIVGLRTADYIERPTGKCEKCVILEASFGIGYECDPPGGEPT